MIRSALKRSIKKVFGMEPAPEAAPVPAPVWKVPVQAAPAAAAKAESAPVVSPVSVAAPAVDAAAVDTAVVDTAAVHTAADDTAPVPPAAEPTPAPAAAASPMSPTDDTAGAGFTFEAVQEIMDEMVRPALQGDGGDITLLRIENIGREVPERRRRAHALVLEVLGPIPERVSPECHDHELREGRCSGCPWMIATPAFQRDQKRIWLESEFGLIVSEFVAGPSDYGYRWSSKRVARSNSGGLRLGSFRRGTHQVADMGSCAVDHPDIAACARQIAERLARFLAQPRPLQRWER